MLPILKRCDTLPFFKCLDEMNIRRKADGMGNLVDITLGGRQQEFGFFYAELQNVLHDGNSNVFGEVMGERIFADV